MEPFRSRKKSRKCAPTGAVLSTYAVLSLTTIVVWGVGKKPRRDSFSRFTVVDDEILVFIARNLARRRRHRSVAIALFHASNMHQREIARILEVDQATVSRGLRAFLDAFYRTGGGQSVV